MAIPKSKTKPTLNERERARSKKENERRGKNLDKTRQRKTSRNGGALKPSKKVELSGADRAWIADRVRKISMSARTEHEKRLLRKVK